MNTSVPGMAEPSNGRNRIGQPPSEPIAIRHYLLIVRKYIRPIALFALIVTSIAAIYALTATPVYRATATLSLDEQTASLVPLDELFGVDGENEEFFETQVEILRSRATAQQVIEQLKMWQDAELGGGDDVPATLGQGLNTTDNPDLSAGQEEVISAFLKRLRVNPLNKTKLVALSYESATPEVAAKVANTLGEVYIQNALDGRLAQSTIATDWLDERLGALKADVDEAEARLTTFRRENDLIAIQGNVGRLNEQQLLLNTAELAQARSELAAARSLLNDVQALRGNAELLETVPDVLADPLVQRTKIEQANAQRELSELLNRYGERHPRVIDAQSELVSLSNALESNINRVAATIAKDYQLAQQRVASINASLSGGRSDIQLIGDKRFEFEALQFEVDTKRSIYDQYFNRRAEYASKDGLQPVSARITDRARISASPVKPKKPLIIGAALLGSLFLGLVAAFLREALDDTVKGTSDVESKLGLSLLGLLPIVKPAAGKRIDTLPLSPDKVTGAHDPFSEAVNSVRTALTLNSRESDRKVIVVTSSVRGEGKSTSAINIAHALGQLERVLLIDCDMRRPSVARAAGLPISTRGLSDLIANTASAEDCFKIGEFGGHVDILPSGPIPDKPLEMLSSKRFARIVKEAASYYDRVIIDSPPTQAVSDALVLAQLADTVIYVVKSHDTSINLVRRGITRLQRAGGDIEGILMTQVDIDKMIGYCGNYSIEGYHDAYDLYEYSEDGEKRSSRFSLSLKELIDIRDDNSTDNLSIHPAMERDDTEDDTPRPSRIRRHASAKNPHEPLEKTG